jgi:uncharacterized protein DUF2442
MSCHAIDVIQVSVIENYELMLTFEDGKTGRIDIAKYIPFKGIFSPLKDKQYFSQVYVNKNIGTICWNNGADIAPEFLYTHLE